jgi:hypothetical protein
MAETPATHNAECAQKHDDHLCFLMYQGFHLSHPDEYRKMVQNAQYRCQNCSRTAESADHLCEPIKL